MGSTPPSRNVRPQNIVQADTGLQHARRGVGRLLGVAAGDKKRYVADSQGRFWCTSIKVHDSSTGSPGRIRPLTALTLFGGALARTSTPDPVRLPDFRLQFAELTPGDYQCGLFPLPSPVLRESPM